MAKDRRILFSGEAQLAMWGESSTAGAWVKMWIHPEDLESFKAIKARAGKQAGQRLGVCIVEIADDETVVEQPDPTPAPAPRRASMGDLALLSVRWCRDPRFQQWAGDKIGDDYQLSEDDAKAFVLRVCGVASRKDIDTDPEAAARFHDIIRAPFAQYLKELG